VSVAGVISSFDFTIAGDVADRPFRTAGTAAFVGQWSRLARACDAGLFRTTAGGLGKGKAWKSDDKSSGQGQGFAHEPTPWFVSELWRFRYASRSNRQTPHHSQGFSSAMRSLNRVCMRQVRFKNQFGSNFDYALMCRDHALV
jgi:hypothetical protein